MKIRGDAELKLLILGSKGMSGHVINLYMTERGHETDSYNDRDNFAGMRKVIEQGSYDAVINCEAVINQDAEADKAEAVKINSLLPHFLASITAGTDTVIVNRSTDCIFSGEKGGYTLDDIPDGTSFYARSKALGEVRYGNNITIRTSVIGPETDPQGRGLFSWFMRQSGDVNGYTGAVWTGITTIEFARCVETMLETGMRGIYQLVPDYSVSKYELLCMFAEYYPGDRNVVAFDSGRNDKSLVQSCGGISVPGYREMIAEMRAWTDRHIDIYPHLV